MSRLVGNLALPIEDVRRMVDTSGMHRFTPILIPLTSVAAALAVVAQVTDKIVSTLP